MGRKKPSERWTVTTALEAAADWRKEGYESSVPVVLADEVESLRMAVDRVRELCKDPHGTRSEPPGLVICVDDVLRALDGDAL